MSAQHIEEGDLVCFLQGRGYAEGRVANVDRERGLVRIRRESGHIAVRQLRQVTFVAWPEAEKKSSVEG